MKLSKSKLKSLAYEAGFIVDSRGEVTFNDANVTPNLETFAEFLLKEVETIVKQKGNHLIELREHFK